MASSSRETESSPSRGIGMKRRRNIRAVGILSVFLISLSLQTGNAERFRSSDSIRGMQQDHTSSSSYVSHVQSDRRNRKGDKRVVVKRGILGGGDIHRQLPSSRGKGGGNGSGGGGTGYTGCLGYSDSDLDSNWIFPGNAPPCSYVVHTGGKGKGGSSNSSGGSSGGSNGGGGGGSSGSSGSSGGGGNGGGGGSSNGGSGDGNGNGGGNNGGGGNGGGGNGNGGNANGGNNNGGNGNGGNNNNGGNGNGGNNNNGGNANGGNNSNGGNGNGGNNNNGGNANGGNNNNGGGGNNNNNGGNVNAQNEGDGGDNDDEVVYYNGDGGGDDDSYTDAFDDFDITQCDTYSNLWMWDLSMTCDDANTFDNCECIYTELLMENGYLSCSDIALCPQNCDICVRCLQISGCIMTTGSSGGGGGVTITSHDFPFFIIAIAVTTMVVAAVTYTKVRQRRNSNALKAHLIEDNPKSDQHTWLAPTEIPGENHSPPIQFVPGEATAANPSSRPSKTNSNEPKAWMPPTEFPDDILPYDESPSRPVPIPIPILRADESPQEVPASDSDEGKVWLAPMTMDIHTTTIRFTDDDDDV